MFFLFFFFVNKLKIWNIDGKTTSDPRFVIWQSKFLIKNF